MNALTKIFITAIVALTLSACSSGGSDTTNNNAGDNPPINNEDVINEKPVNVGVTGVWEGTFTENGGSSFEIFGIIENNNMRFISLAANTIYSGNIGVDGDKFTSTTAILENGGGILATAYLTGTVIENTSMSGTFTTSYGTTGVFNMRYSNTNSKGSALSNLDSNWINYGVTSSSSISIDSTGMLTGTDGYGCNYYGRSSVSDPNSSIYKLAVNISSCGVYDGDYTGYIVVSDEPNKNDSLNYVIDNSNFILLGQYKRS